MNRCRHSSLFLPALVTMLILALATLGFTGCAAWPEDTPVVAEPGDGPNAVTPGTGDTTDPDSPSLPTYSVTVRDGVPFMQLSTVRTLLEDEGWRVDWDTVNRQLTVSKEERQVKTVSGVPVVNRTGVYEPLEHAIQVDSESGQVLVPAKFLQTGFGWAVEEADENEQSPVVSVDVTATSSWPPALDVPDTPQETSERLSFLQSPLEGARAGFADSQVPGAARAYRNGTHEGFDWYDYRIGIAISRETPVLAMANGVVVRANPDWTTPTVAERNRWLARTSEAKRTPSWILDLLRGRQVWIMHENGVMVRYAHLSSIADGIAVGTHVEAGQVLGHVGNSGTGAEAEGTDYGLHLHSDILLYGHNVWLQFKPSTIRDIMSTVLNE